MINTNNLLGRSVNRSPVSVENLAGSNKVGVHPLILFSLEVFRSFFKYHRFGSFLLIKNKDN